MTDLPFFAVDFDFSRETREEWWNRRFWLAKNCKGHWEECMGFLIHQKSGPQFVGAKKAGKPCLMFEHEHDAAAFKVCFYNVSKLAST